MTITPVDTIQDSITAYWDRRAPSYAEFHRDRDDQAEYARAWADLWTRALPPAPARVLDLGTGSGKAAVDIARLDHDVTGIDLSASMLAQARGLGARVARPPTFALGDAVDPRFPARTFDAVTARYLVWTLRETAQALRRWRRLLRPGGRLAVVDSTWFPSGLDGHASSEFGDHYGSAVRAALPLAEARSISATVDLIEQTGFVNVTCTALDELHELDSVHGVASGHEVRLQYLIVAEAPDRA